MLGPQMNGSQTKVLDSIHTKITKISKKVKAPEKKHLLSDRTCKDYLENFQKSVPADKSSNNILIVCRKYYLDVVLKELDTNDGTSPQTYTRSSTPIENLVAEHKEFMDRQNLRLPEEMRQLPTFYWLPKMHKTPIGSRFIAASGACTTKPRIPITLTSCLKLVTQHFKEYSEGIARNTGVNCFWIIRR